MQLYQKVFTGEIPPLLITENTATNKPFTLPDNTQSSYKEVPLIKWRDIAKKHLPRNGDIESAEYEFKLEYLHIDYLLPSLTPVPSSKIPTQSVQDTNVTVQNKVIDMKTKFNVLSGHGKEIRLIRSYDPNYELTATGDNFNNSLSYDITLDYPISEILYNNRISGFLDLMPYLIKNGNLTFADVQQQLSLLILTNLGSKDSIVISGGYSGTVTYELKKRVLTVTKSETVSIGTTAIEVLPFNPDRVGFYLTNNSLNEIYFNFGLSPNMQLVLTLKPKQMLIYENQILTIDGIKQDLEVDKRYTLGLPLWCRANTNGNQVSIEELSLV